MARVVLADQAGVAITMTADAAARTGLSLIEAAATAEEQARTDSSRA